MSYCDGEITQDIILDCNNLQVRGVEAEGVIINRGDFDFDAVNFDASNPNIITNFPLKVGTKGYRVQMLGATPFTGTNTTLEVGTYRNSFTNNVGMVILANDPDVSKNVIDGLANGKYIVVLENKNKNINHTSASKKGYSTFQVYGFHQGLVASALESDKYSEDTEGGWSVTLTEERVPKSALFLFSVDIETTRTLVNSLTA